MSYFVIVKTTNANKNYKRSKEVPLIDLMKPLGAIEIHKDLSEKKRFIEVNI